MKYKSYIESRAAEGTAREAYDILSGGAAPEDARRLRDAVEVAAESFDDAVAMSYPALYPIWQPDKHYVKGARVRDPEDGLLYKLIPEEHDSLANWPPRLVPAIWTRVDEPGEEWPEWHQPTGAHDAYEAGKKVSHNGHHWINTYGDGNNWEPGVYGWELVE